MWEGSEATANMVIDSGLINGYQQLANSDEWQWQPQWPAHLLHSDQHISYESGHSSTFSLKFSPFVCLVASSLLLSSSFSFSLSVGYLAIFYS